MNNKEFTNFVKAWAKRWEENEGETGEVVEGSGNKGGDGNEDEENVGN